MGVCGDNKVWGCVASRERWTKGVEGCGVAKRGGLKCFAWEKLIDTADLAFFHAAFSQC